MSAATYHTNDSLVEATPNLSPCETLLSPYSPSSPSSQKVSAWRRVCHWRVASEARAAGPSCQVHLVPGYWCLVAIQPGILLVHPGKDPSLTTVA